MPCDCGDSRLRETTWDFDAEQFPTASAHPERSSRCYSFLMSGRSPSLFRLLSGTLALKFLLLGVLWWTFVRDAQVEVDPQRMAAHLGVHPTNRPGTSP